MTLTDGRIVLDDGGCFVMLGSVYITGPSPHQMLQPPRGRSATVQCQRWPMPLSQQSIEGQQTGAGQAG